MKPEVKNRTLSMSLHLAYILVIFHYFSGHVRMCLFSSQNFLFKSTKEDSPLKATDFGLSDFIKPGAASPSSVYVHIWYTYLAASNLNRE
jgi:hypothetical protein